MTGRENVKNKEQRTAGSTGRIHPAVRCLIVVGNCVPYVSKVSGGKRTPPRGRWLLAQPRTGGNMRTGAHLFPLQIGLSRHASQRPAAPQGSTSPVSVTGSPISSERTVPLYLGQISVPIR